MFPSLVLLSANLMRLISLLKLTRTLLSRSSFEQHHCGQLANLWFLSLGLTPWKPVHSGRRLESSLKNWTSPSVKAGRPDLELITQLTSCWSYNEFRLESRSSGFSAYSNLVSLSVIHNEFRVFLVIGTNSLSRGQAREYCSWSCFCKLTTPLLL